MTGHPEASALIQACLWIIVHVDLGFRVQPVINSRPFSPRNQNPFKSSQLKFPIHPMDPNPKGPERRSSQCARSGSRCGGRSHAHQPKPERSLPNASLVWDGLGGQCVLPDHKATQY